MLSQFTRMHGRAPVFQIGRRRTDDGVRRTQRRINEGVSKALQAPDVREKLATFTYEAYTMAPADMAKLMQQEVVKWGPTIKQATIKLD